MHHRCMVHMPSCYTVTFHDMQINARAIVHADAGWKPKEQHQLVNKIFLQDRSHTHFGLDGRVGLQGFLDWYFTSVWPELEKHT